VLQHRPGESETPSRISRIERSGAVPQEQEQKKAQRKGGGDADADAAQVRSTSKASELKEEMDDILDEIDSVLEENAEEFVKSYVQKGGE
jgi:ubiquitin-like protein Pup